MYKVIDTSTNIVLSEVEHIAQVVEMINLLRENGIEVNVKEDGDVSSSGDDRDSP